MPEDRARKDSSLHGALTELRALRERARQDGCTLRKWARMLNVLVALLEDKGIASKDEVMLNVYERLRDSGALERSEAVEEAN